MMETALKTVIRYPEYKDSGVEWLGEMPDHWELGKLGRILKPISEKNQPNFPLLSITREEGVIERNINDDSENHNFIPDDLSGYKVLKEGQFGMNKMKAWQGSYGVAPLTGIVSPAYYIFDFINNINPNYFHKAIRSKNYVAFFGKASDGVRIGQWDLNKGRMKEIPLFIPPLPEQTAIANFLDDKTEKIDRAVSIKEKQIALLKERRQIIIQELVTGKKVWNEANQAWGKPEKTIDSGVEWIGEIPEEWEVKRLKQITETYGRIGFRGYSTSDLVDKDEGAITISPSNIKGDFMLFDKCTYLSWKKYHESPEIKVYKDDVLIVKTGSTFGKVGIASNLTEKATINPQLLVFKNIEVENDFFYEILNSIHIQTQVNQEIIGSTIPTISENKILNMKAIFPPKESEKQIVDNINKLKSKYNKLVTIKEIEIEKLKEYKASLVNDVVLGRVRVTSV